MWGRSKTVLFMFFMITGCPLAGMSATISSDEVLDQIDYSSNVLGILEKTLSDHQASVKSVQGEAEILKISSAEWTSLRRGELIQEGDQIRTGTDAYVELSYDDYHLNYARIEENSIVEFSALEPTRIHIEEGSIFNTLDGLIDGADYEISTPTSVASVRGTSFIRSFNSETLSDDTSVVEGVVDVLPVIDDYGNVDQRQKFQVTRDQSLTFDEKAIKSRDFRRARPVKMASQRKERLQKIHQTAVQNRERFAGGGSKAKALRKKFKQLKQNPQRAQAVQNRLRTHREAALNRDGQQKQGVMRGRDLSSRNQRQNGPQNRIVRHQNIRNQNRSQISEKRRIVGNNQDRKFGQNQRRMNAQQKNRGMNVNQRKQTSLKSPANNRSNNLTQPRNQGGISRAQNKPQMRNTQGRNNPRSKAVRRNNSPKPRKK